MRCLIYLLSSFPWLKVNLPASFLPLQCTHKAIVGDRRRHCGCLGRDDGQIFWNRIRLHKPHGIPLPDKGNTQQYVNCAMQCLLRWPHTKRFVCYLSRLNTTICPSPWLSLGLPQSFGLVFFSIHSALGLGFGEFLLDRHACLFTLVFSSELCWLSQNHS